MNENYVIQTGAAKWLWMIFYITLASMINSVISVIPAVPSALTAWISRGIIITFVFCTYRLSSENEHYKKATTYRAVMLASTLAGTYIFKSTVLTLVASFLSILAVYQEYSAHSELIQERDSKLAGKWHSLFYWGLVTAVLVSFGTMIAAVVASVSGMDVSHTTTIILIVLSIPQLVIDAVYLSYLRKMIQLMDMKNEVSYEKK